MKRTCKITALVLALVMTIGLLAGCSVKAEEKTPSTDLVVVALQGSNMPAASAEVLAPYLEEAVSAETNSSFTLIVADSEPFQGGHVKWDSRESLNEAHWKEEKEARISQCIDILLNQKANAPETDLLGALDLASRALRDGDAVQKKLIIVHNGVTTAGPLSFIGTDLGALDESTIQDVIAQLTEKQVLPDLTGVQVDWIYLGEGVTPQESASSQIRANLQQLWENVLKTCCADTVTFKSTLPDTGAVEGAPAVTPVACSQQQIELPDLSEPVPLDPTAIGFAPDATELSDSAATAEYLAPYAEAICQNDDDSRYVVAGSTADTAGSTAESSQQFGLKRALTVCRILQELGVEKKSLLPLGIGTLPTSVRSADDQAANRTCWLVQADSDLGRELLNIGLGAA